MVHMEISQNTHDLVVHTIGLFEQAVRIQGKKNGIPSINTIVYISILESKRCLEEYIKRNQIRPP